MKTTVRPTPWVWAAGPDGVAHAHLRGRPPRTVCDIRPVGEQFTWPAKARCRICEVRVTP